MMTNNAYVVIYRDEDYICSSEFDIYDEAYAFVYGAEKQINCGKYGTDGENIGHEKAYIIRIENAKGATIIVEPHGKYAGQSL